ncbi:hypothetical protein AKO1_011815 [Acrasis kona]|uniref:Peptidase M16 C-terminal domain-containing protein n=1 Tax=Acrasis kona TaxID=1008807 RepID=A0AAW2Z5H3_9EUKA
MRKSTMSNAVLKVLENHGGSTWRIGSRFPIGKDPIIRSWSTNDLTTYYNKWYHPKHMTFYMVGDIDLDLTIVEAELGKIKSDITNEKPVNMDIGKATPEKKLLYIDGVDGVDGIMINTIITKEYQGYPRHTDYYRKQIGDIMFTIVYSFQVLSRLLSSYPDMSIDDLTKRNAACAVVNMYALNSTIYDFAILTPSSPTMGPSEGTYRQDLTMAVQEMKGLADMGPNNVMLIAIAYVLSATYQSTYYVQGHVDSKLIIQLLLSDEDPSHTYHDVEETIEMNDRYLRFGFATHFHDHVQAQAQFVLDSFISTFDDSHASIYPHVIRDDPVSTGILIGKSNTPEGIPTLDQKTLTNIIIKAVKQEQVIPNDGVAGLISPSAGANLLPVMNSINIQSIPKALLPKSDLPTPTLINTRLDLGITTYQLLNGIKINFKNVNVERMESMYPATSQIELVALGGRNSQSPDLQGACDYVNENLISGYTYYSSSNFDDDDLIHRWDSNGATLIPLQCDQDYISMNLQLEYGCITYPEPYQCDLISSNYSNQFQSLRIAMNPNYNYLTNQKVVESFEKNEAIVVEGDLISVVGEKIQNVIHDMVKNTTNAYRPTTVKDLKSLNPLNVQYWVSNHFDPLRSRFELNVIGHVNVNAVLEAAQRWIGTIVNIPELPTRGYDPYSSLHVAHFEKVTLSSSANTSRSCQVRDEPGRAFVGMILPAPTVSNNNWLEHSFVHAGLLNTLMFDVIRSQHGYSYFVSRVPFYTYSVLFPRLSAYALIWGTGDYPSNSVANDTLNTQSSFNLVNGVMSESIPADIFERAKDSYLGSVKAQLQDPVAWLSLMRGMSIAAPASWGKADGEVIRGDLDLVGAVTRMDYQQWKDVYAEAMHSKDRVDGRVVVETVTEAINKC